MILQKLKTAAQHQEYMQKFSILIIQNEWNEYYQEKEALVLYKINLKISN